jgi:hypothetical protein
MTVEENMKGRRHFVELLIDWRNEVASENQPLLHPDREAISSKKQRARYGYLSHPDWSLLVCGPHEGRRRA